MVGNLDYLIIIYGGMKQECIKNLFKEKFKMKFELGKYYIHTSGRKLYICGLAETNAYGIFSLFFLLFPAISAAT